MFTLKPRKSALAQLGDVLVAIVALPVLGVAWVVSKAIGAINDNI